VQESKFKFPYRARTPEGFKRFDSIGDVYNQLLNTAYESEKEGYKVGEAVYYEHLFWANSEDLIDTRSQTLIKSYMYCTESGTSPYPSLQDTPADYIDNWMIIRDEINHIRNLEVKNANK